MLLKARVFPTVNADVGCTSKSPEWSRPRYRGWLILFGLIAVVVTIGQFFYYAFFIDENFGDESLFCHSPDTKPGVAEEVECTDAVVSIAVFGPLAIFIVSAIWSAAQRTLVPFRVGLGLLLATVLLGLIAFT